MYTSYASKQCDNLSQKELEKRLKKILGLNIKPKLKKKKGGRMTKPKYKSKKIKSKKIKTKKIKTYKSSEDLVPKSGTNKSACRLASELKKKIKKLKKIDDLYNMLSYTGDDVFEFNE
jgi:hypothetical protein